jgi:hypothetical protein
LSSQAATAGDPPCAADVRLNHAMRRLASLHEGDSGLVEAVAIGAAAIAPLTVILCERQPSGLFQARCRAVEALAALKAFSVLADFLRTRYELVDPVERLGEDVVVSAAARAIARLREPWVYELLVDLARRRPLQGVLCGLGSFFRIESAPVFIDALLEDELRLTAEAVLRGFGPKVRPHLVAAAVERGGDARGESESHLRKRRGALAVLGEVGITRRDWPTVEALIDDPDHEIALLTCELGIKVAGAADQRRIADRLEDLRATASWIQRERIDEQTKSLRSPTSARVVGPTTDADSPQITDWTKATRSSGEEPPSQHEEIL